MSGWAVVVVRALANPRVRHDDTRADANLEAFAPVEIV